MRNAEAIRDLQLVGNTFGVGGHVFCGCTLTMAGALPANSVIFTLKYLAQGAHAWGNGKKGFVSWMSLHWTCLSSFNTPTFQGRRLAIDRIWIDQLVGVPENCIVSGGVPASLKPSMTDLSVGPWEARIATTNSMSLSVPQWDGPRTLLNVTSLGNANAVANEVFTFDDGFLYPGELLVVTNPQAMDAGGTWQLIVKGGCSEMPR